ncbi:Methylsterol monooxygenase 2-2 [Nymphaea thermarum]|nr:Methylsterol monooxygenase 2-2 [Nymphaea thermarum]
MTMLMVYHFCVNLRILLVSYPELRISPSKYAHPFEIVFLGFATVIGPTIRGPHLFTCSLWMALRVLETVDAHYGYDFPLSLSKVLPIYGGHDFGLCLAIFADFA